MTTASLIREGRRRSGMTQSELASRVGTTQSAVARWEAGRSRPPFETLQRIVRACGLELRVELEPIDENEIGVLERNLALNPAERLDQLVRAVAFLRAGRARIAKRRG